MGAVPTLVAGGLFGFAFSMGPAAAYGRVVARAPGPALRIGAAAAWPDVCVVAAVLLLARAVLLVYRPDGPLEEGLLSIPLLTFLLARGWGLVESPAAVRFSREAVPEPPDARAVLAGPLRHPWQLPVAVLLALPPVHFLVRDGELALPAFAAGFGLAVVALHVALARVLTRHRNDRPYLIMPAVSRALRSLAGLVLFAFAFGVVAATVIDQA